MSDGRTGCSAIPSDQVRRLTIALRFEPPPEMAPPGTASAVTTAAAITVGRPTLSAVAAGANNVIRPSPRRALNAGGKADLIATVRTVGHAQQPPSGI